MGCCGFCGLPLRDDLTRTCDCRPPSTFERVALAAALVGSTEPRPPTPKLRARRARALLCFASVHVRTEGKPS